jgi:hypothetical protein
MTDIEQKTLVERLRIIPDQNGLMYGDYEDVMQAADLIEQHEAFRQEVSDVASVCAQHFCENSWTVGDRQDHVDMLSRFIIPKPKPDPLVEALNEAADKSSLDDNDFAAKVRAALAVRGLEIREKNDD